METLKRLPLKTVVASKRGIRNEVRSGLAGWNSVRISPLVSLAKKRIVLVPMFVSRLSSSDLQMSLDDENSRVQSELTTVHVRFQLQRECSFGEQFYLVGDRLMLGNWDPENALPLEWSDGHVWTLDLEIPVGETIQYKFLLKGDSTMDVIWQQGSDRIFKAWKCSSRILVEEDWEDQCLQKIIEEEEEPLSSIHDSTVDASYVSIEEETVGDMEKMRFESNNDNEFAIDMNSKEANLQLEEEEEEEPICNVSIEEEKVGNMEKMRFEPNNDNESAIDMILEEANLQHEEEEEEEPICSIHDSTVDASNVSIEEETVGNMEKMRFEPNNHNESAINMNSEEANLQHDEDEEEETITEVSSHIANASVGDHDIVEEKEVGLVDSPMDDDDDDDDEGRGIEYDLPQSGDERNKSYNNAYSSENIELENELQWCLKTLQHILPFWPWILRKQV